MYNIKNDGQMAFNNLPSQYVDAHNFYKRTKSNFPNRKIVFTGHSLCGSLAQIIGSQTGDLIWVNSYNRDDGTKVCGYYRRK